jgi:phosphoribosylaminoimidazole-succinocarboxamide synthase
LWLVLKPSQQKHKQKKNQNKLKFRKVSDIPNVEANGIQIEYDTFGNSSSSALLLIMGFTAQMILFDEVLCDQLSGKGLYVIQFDNRDTGLFTKFEEAGRIATSAIEHIEAKELVFPNWNFYPCLTF